MKHSPLRDDAVATSMAENALEEEHAIVGQVEVPIEEQSDSRLQRV